MAEDLLEKRKQELRRRYAKGLRDGDLDETDIDRFAQEDLKAGKITSTPEASSPIAPAATPVPTTPAPPPAPIPSPSSESEAPTPAAEPKGPALASAPKKSEYVTSPEVLEKRLAKLNEIRASVPEDKQAEYTNGMNKVNEFARLAKEEYQNNKDNTRWAEAADIIGQAVAKLASGYYGMKHGVDLSGVKFQAKDWSKDLDRLLSEYKLETDLLQAEGEKVQKSFDVESKKQEALAKDQRDVLQQQFSTEDRQGAAFQSAKQSNIEKNTDRINRFNEEQNKEKSDKSAKQREKSLSKIEQGRSLLEQLKEADSARDRTRLKKELAKVVSEAGKDGKSLLAAIKAGEEAADPIGPNFLYGDLPEATAEAEALLDQMKKEIEEGNATVRKANAGANEKSSATFKDKKTGQTATLSDPSEISAARKDPELEEIE